MKREKEFFRPKVEFFKRSKNRRGANTTLKRWGFTIVELMVVIVVIAILATVTIVAYRGIQQRAYTSKAQSTVDSYTKIFETYSLQNNGYPDTNGNAICLGEAADYEATDEFSAGECMDVYGASTFVDTALNSQIRDNISTAIPSGSLPKVEYDGYANVRGVIYSGEPDVGKIIYVLKGEQTCPNGERNIDGDGNTECIVTLGDDFCWYSGDT